MRDELTPEATKSVSKQSKVSRKVSAPKLVFIASHCVCSVTQLCPTLCYPMGCRPPGSSVHGVLQARILEWRAISFSRGSPKPAIEPASLASPALAGRFFTTTAAWEALFHRITMVYLNRVLEYSLELKKARHM